MHSYGAQRAGSPVPNEVHTVASAARWKAPVVDTTTVPASPRQTTSLKSSPPNPVTRFVHVPPPSNDRRMPSLSAWITQTSSSFAGLSASSMLPQFVGSPPTSFQVEPPSKDLWSLQTLLARTTAKNKSRLSRPCSISSTVPDPKSCIS